MASKTKKAQAAPSNYMSQTIIAKDLTPLQFNRLIASLRNFDIYESLHPNLTSLRGTYKETTQDKRLAHALNYLFNTFFNEKKEDGKSLHIAIDDFHFNQHDDSENDTEGGVDDFSANLAEFFQLFSRVVCTLLAYTHDYQNHAHYYIEKHDMVSSVMAKWKLVLAHMADVYSTIRTKACKNLKLAPVSNFWDFIIKDNISAVHDINEKMMRYELMLNDARNRLTERDRKINSILEDYAEVNLKMPTYQGEFDKAREELNKLNTGAESLEEFDESKSPKDMELINTRGGKAMTTNQRAIAQKKYSTQGAEFA